MYLIISAQKDSHNSSRTNAWPLSINGAFAVTNSISEMAEEGELERALPCILPHRQGVG